MEATSQHSIHVNSNLADFPPLTEKSASVRRVSAPADDSPSRLTPEEARGGPIRNKSSCDANFGFGPKTAWKESKHSILHLANS
ncbi:hypothetical protein NQZ68_002626 [Dissostichus eleginoides]|nr:hypothetical protein NQZ68_002626 [Dissostichus eleginoides]